MRLIILIALLQLCGCAFMKENVRIEPTDNDYREYQQSRTWDEKDADEQQSDEIHRQINDK